MAQTAKAQSSRLMLTPKALQKALTDSAQKAHNLAAAFGMKVPGIKPKPPLKKSGISASPKAVRFDDDILWVSLSDGRTIAAPLAWFPRLLQASPEQRAQVELSKDSLHWDALHKDISIAGLLAGQPDLSRRRAPQSV
jgi:hypothetical protein